MKTLLMTAISALLLMHGRAAAPGAGTGNVPVNAPVSNVSTSTYPAGVTEIMKLLDANVDRETVKAYIHNSFTYWNLTADAIIRLKERGVPSDVIAAMLDRDVELREQAIRTAQANANAGMYGTNGASPSYDSGQYAPTYVYPPDYADGSGYAYPYSYPYPYDYGGWYGWPVWGGGVIFFDLSGHCHFDHHNNGHFDHFHGGHADFHGQFNNGTARSSGFIHGNNGWFPGTGQPSKGWFPGASGFSGVNGTTHASGAVARMGAARFSGSNPAFGVAGAGRSSGSMQSVPRMGGVSMGHVGGAGGGMRMGSGGGGGGRGFGR